MARTSRSPLIAALAAGALLAGCGGGADGDPVEVALSELVADPDGLDGQVIVAEGVVRTYDEPRHYWIEDADLNRLEIVPEDRISSHVGEQVRVVGTYSFRDDVGRRITVEDVDDVEVLGGGTAGG